MKQYVCIDSTNIVSLIFFIQAIEYDSFCPDGEYICMFGRASWTETRDTLGTGFESGDVRERSDYEPQLFTGPSQGIPVLYDTKRHELGRCRGVGC